MFLDNYYTIKLTSGKIKTVGEAILGLYNGVQSSYSDDL